MSERPNLRGSRQLTQRSTSRTNSASTQHGHPLPSPQPIPVPSPVSPLEPRRRSFYATNPDPHLDTEDSADEYMNVLPEEADGNAMGYHNEQVVNPRVPRKKGSRNRFIGGFVKSLRKVPRAMMFRSAPPANEPSVEQPAARRPMPTYMFTPPTPVAPPQQSSYIDEARLPFPQPETEPLDIFPAATSPDPTRIEVDETTTNRDPDAPVSRHASQQNHTTHNSFAYPSSYRDPPSIAAHPQPSPDYRRMSRHTGDESVPAHPLSYSSPSFSTELDRAPLRLMKAFSTLINMPWISHDRTTVDYSPGMDGSRGVLRTVPPEDLGARTGGRNSKDRQSVRWSIVNQGWQPWKRTSVFFTFDGRLIPTRDGPTALARGDARKGKMYVPVDKPLTSWYSGGYKPQTRRSAKAKRELDLVSSGSEHGVRSSIGSVTRRAPTRQRVSRSTITSPSSPASPSSTRPAHFRRQPPRRRSQLYYRPSEEYMFIDSRSTPASSPILGRRSNPKPRSREHRYRERNSNFRRRSSRDTPRPSQPPLPPSGSPYPLSPLVFLPSNHLDGATGGVESSHPQASTSVQVPVLGVTPVYMSVVPGVLPPPRSVGSAGESSPPGFAGRGAGYTNGPGYNVQGYSGPAFNGAGGTYTYGYTYPYPHSQSPPPHVHPDDHKHTSQAPR